MEPQQQVVVVVEPEVEPEVVPPEVVVLPPPTPAAPLCTGEGKCDCTAEDLDADNGQVAPDFGDVPGGSFEADPLEAGTFAVRTSDHDVANPNEDRDGLETTVYLPEADAPMPLLLLMPGFTLSHRDSAHFSEHFASHGIAVGGFTPRAWGFLNVNQDNAKTTAEAIAVLDWALSEESPLSGRVDLEKIGVVGYSEGGKIAFHAAAIEPRFKLLVAWDPQNGGGAPCFVPIFGGACNNSPAAPNCETEESGVLHQVRAESLIFAARDTSATPDGHMRAEHFYRGAPSPSHLVYMPDVGHTGWLSDGGAVEVSKRVQLALVLARFRGMSGLDEYLPGGGYAASADGVQDVRSK